jgi:hypothetical protein
VSQGCADAVTAEAGRAYRHEEKPHGRIQKGGSKKEKSHAQRGFLIGVP